MEHRGQIGLLAGPVTRLQWLVSAATTSPAFHVVVGLGSGQVLSANPGGVRIEPEEQHPRAVWSRFPLTPEQIEGVVAWGMARLARPYNWVSDAMITVEAFTPIRFPDRMNTRVAGDRRYTCSQFADAALRFGAGYHVFDDGRRPGQVTPASFVPVFRANGWWPEAYDWAARAAA